MSDHLHHLARSAADGPPDDASSVIPHRRLRDRHADEGGQRGPRIGLNVTAMIDVVFLLLVYFMAATNFRLGEEVYRLDLPERGTAAAADPFELDDEPLVIRVATIAAAEAAGVPGYSIRIDGPYDQPDTFRSLHDFLQRRQFSETSFEGLFADDHPVVIEPTPRTRWEHAIEAFNAAARAGYTNVTLAAPDVAQPEDAL